ncbi:hypothetical protein DSUL_20171 [Desulfovibrionales bacterium]
MPLELYILALEEAWAMWRDLVFLEYFRLWLELGTIGAEGLYTVEQSGRHSARAGI